MKTIISFAAVFVYVLPIVSFAQDSNKLVELKTNSKSVEFENKNIAYTNPYYSNNPYYNYGNPNYGNPYYGNPHYGNPNYGNPYYGNPNYGNPYYGNPNYGNPYHNGNNQSNHHWGVGGNNAHNYVDNKSFNNFISALNSESFDNSKLKMAKFYVSSATLTAEQIGKTLDQFTFDSNRVEFAKVAYQNCYDKHNYVTLRNRFTFSSSFESVMRYLGY